MDMLLQTADLVHHLLINSQSAGSIDDDYVVALGFSLLYGMVGNLVDIFVVRLAIHWNADTLTDDFQLVDGGRAIDVARYEQRLLMLLLLEHIGELAAERGLTRALKTRHQDDRRLALQLELGSLTTHELGQFIVHNLHHQLSRLDGGEYVHTQRFLLDRIGERFGYLIVDISVEQRAANVLQRLGYVYFCDFALAFQHLERAFKAVG